MRSSGSIRCSFAVLVLAACGSSSNTPSTADCCAADAGRTLHDDSGSDDGGGARPLDAGADHGIAMRDSAAPPVDGGPHPDAGDAKLCSGCRDWSANPAVLEVDGATELWVLSDIHGDYYAATKLLTAAHLLASVPASATAAEWAGGTATFVVVGDMIDKGPDAPDVVKLMIALQASAAAGQGRVVVTMGNHEAEFLADPEDSKSEKSDGFDPELASLGLTPDATAAGDNPIGAFIRGLPIAARVDDWFFVHAGNAGGKTVAELSSEIQAGVDSSGFGATVLSNANSLLEARLNDSPPQWWDATGNATSLLTTWTTALGAKHLVMGHQPGKVGISGSSPHRSPDQMAAEYGGLLFLIDTGMSVDVDDTGGALLHVTGVGTSSEAWNEVLPDGSTKSL